LEHWTRHRCATIANLQKLKPANVYFRRLSNLYKPTTKPTGTTSQTEANELKELIISLIAKTEADFQKDIFTTYNERTTATGFHLASIKDAFVFNNYHEVLHFGYMMSIRKFA
jgi:hypothetical protein